MKTHKGVKEFWQNVQFCIVTRKQKVLPTWPADLDKVG